MSSFPASCPGMHSSSSQRRRLSKPRWDEWHLPDLFVWLILIVSTSVTFPGDASSVIHGLEMSLRNVCSDFRNMEKPGYLMSCVTGQGWADLQLRQSLGTEFYTPQDVGCISKETGSNTAFWTCEWPVTAWHDCMPEQHPWSLKMETACELVVQSSSQVPLLYILKLFCCIGSHTFTPQFPISESD